jgi:hypothetical protein
MIQVTQFLQDYAAALSTAQAFDAKVRSDASAISSDYADIVDLSIRQAMAAIEITVSKNDDGTFNADDILVFMKGQKRLASVLLILSKV